MTTEQKIKIIGNCVGTFANLEDFPKMYNKAMSESYNGFCTSDIIDEGEKFMEGNFTSKQVYPFFCNVMRWGKSDQALANIPKYHKEKEIVDAIKEAIYALERTDIKNAISALIALKGLAIASGSLVLHALSPQQVGAYDKVLQEHFHYSKTADGFVEFCDDLKAVAAELNNNPTIKKENGEWLPADVDSVLFYTFKKS